MKNINVIIVGVGGQGTLLTSRILGNVAFDAEKDVKVSEVHGMSQRGGSVVTYVRVGDNVNSPVIEKGQADVIIAFEELEAIRWFEYLKRDGIFIINSQKINPMPVIIGKSKYPEKILEKINNNCENVIVIDALKYAEDCGNIKTVNVVLLGVFAKITGGNRESWINTIKETVPSKVLDVNIKAFELGYEKGNPDREPLAMIHEEGGDQ